MVFKHKTNGQVANVNREDLIKQFSEDADWEIGTEEDLPKQEIIEHKPTYKDLIIQKIRKKYTIDDEIALINNKDTHPEEYAKYQAYREQCKQEAKIELGMI